MEFHISKKIRDACLFDASIFKTRGNVVFADYRAAQIFAHSVNQSSERAALFEGHFRASDLFAMGMLDEIYHLVIKQYEVRANPGAFQKAFNALAEELEKENVDRSLLRFNMEFPPVLVYRGDLSQVEYYSLDEDGRPNAINTLEEGLLLWLENQNPAFEPYKALFDDKILAQESAYESIIDALYRYFDSQPKFGSKNLNVIDFLLEPSRLYPHSLSAQLEYIRENWGEVIADVIFRLMRSLDFIREDEKMRLGGSGEAVVPSYEHIDYRLEDVIKFAEDKEWMPKLVLIAKNTHVWLHQLSKKYGRAIEKLGDIPEEELDEMRRRGFTGLWLIGLWERSSASARIKQMCGNPEAIASAYSLYLYDIAHDLGGYQGYDTLREKASRYGIRLGSDMVPNHMGIDSPWVVEHPDWFIQLSYPPFPSYQFNGPNLSPDGRVSIQLEDHYYDRSDAGVVFKLHEHWNGRDRYIYHGNDGTSMPWNDTAQLNYLDPAVREAVIETIVQVARKFPIIRFDAAMTLTKRHYQRLWFPEPGSGGDIPSRAEYGLSKGQFDQAMPEEFWREVVARIEKEAPDTLLLAEAFWMMEGYFVRSLGMHRVYNSAFMNMLRDEENAKYRELIKKTLEFEPQILQRYVNFMNNPDERTTVDQFGKGDKYFGVCLMMATLPGLPMFGHGQIEGFAEKYGMEYKKAYWDESPDHGLGARHGQVIFPLLHRRHLFAFVDGFRMYDFYLAHGQVCEDVYAYSNRHGEEKALIVYHNRWAEVRGTIHYSVWFADKQPGAKEFALRQASLAEGLDFTPDSRKFIIFKDQVSGLQFIRSSTDMMDNGLTLSLRAYQFYAFVDFREVFDSEETPYARLNHLLGEKGVPDIHHALINLAMEPVQAPFKEIANKGFFTYLLESCLMKSDERPIENILRESRQKTASLLDGMKYMLGEVKNQDAIVSGALQSIKAVVEFGLTSDDSTIPGMTIYNRALDLICEGFSEVKKNYLVLFCWAFTRYLGLAASGEHVAVTSRSWLVEWKFREILHELFQQFDFSPTEAEEMLDTLGMAIEMQGWYSRSRLMPIKMLMQEWGRNEVVRNYIGVHTYGGVEWFVKEKFEKFIWWLLNLTALDSLAKYPLNNTDLVESLIGAYEVYLQLDEAKKASGYQLQRLVNAIHEY